MAQSATKRSKRPMPTGSPLRPRVHTPSHCVSCGHTRPQIAGSALASLTSAYASANSPWATFSMNWGIGTPTGQPSMQGALGHWMQRRASLMASSAV